MVNYNNPKITVLLPVYNCEPYVKEAIDSILHQTFTDFEFLIIDDASTDSTVDIIKKIKDSRIKLIEKPVNTGYTNSLNLGLELAKGEYIARMDGDDISLPERFAKQVSFLDSNQDVILCGTCFSIIDTNKIIMLPEKNDEIKIAFLKGNNMAHPSVMIRNNKIKEHKLIYDLKKEPAEDYDLWVRILAIGKIHNLQEILLNYRQHDTQVSQKRETEQMRSALESRFKMLKYLNYPFQENDYTLLKKIMLPNSNISFSEIKSFLHLKKKMILANSTNFFDSKAFDEYLTELQSQNVKKYFVKREKYNPAIYFRYLQLRDKHIFKLKFQDECKLLLKSFIYFKRK